MKSTQAIRNLIIIFMMMWLMISVYQNHLKKEPTPVYIHEYIEEAETNA